jgi:PKD repeat protein
LSYAWSFGGMGLHAARTYATVGTYTVTLTATDACGYSQVAAVPVTVLPPGYAVYLPLIMRQ